MLAKPLAGRCAERPVGQGKQYLLAHDILEHEPALVIIPDLGLFFRDGALAGGGIGVGGAEQEVKVSLERLRNGLEAAGAQQGEITGVAGAEADVLDDLLVAAMFEDELGAAVESEGAGLEDVRRVVDDTCGEAGINFERFPCEVCWGDDHGAAVDFLMADGRLAGAGDWVEQRGVLIIVCGLPGSGKTTLARQLEHERKGVRLSADDWMHMLGVNLHDEALRDRVEQMQWVMGRRLLELGQTVIIEWGTWGRPERDALREGTRALGAQVELVYLTAAPEHLFRRIAARAREDPPIRWEQVQGWAERFQVPGAQEVELFDRFEVIAS